MAYEGRFIERCPNIRPAGITVHPENIKDCFQNISIKDKIKAIGITDTEEKKIYPVPKPDGRSFEGLYTSMRGLIQPPLKSAIQTLRDELKETMYTSYWKAPLGKSYDLTPYLPIGTDTCKTTYGISTKSDITAGELLNPPKLPGQVGFESSLGHELYVKTHQDYYPGEHVNRNYNLPSFDPHLKFGKPTPVDSTGIWVAKAIVWFNNENVCPVTQRQADYIERTHHKVGKSLQPNNVLKTCVPTDHTFGRKSDWGPYGVCDIMRYSNPSIEKRDQLDYFAHINKVRFILKRRDPEFPFGDFYETLKSKDTDLKDWIPLDTLYKVCEEYRIPIDRTMIEKLMSLTNVMNSQGMVSYNKFFELINCNFDFPGVPKVTDVPQEYQFYETSYASATHPSKKNNESAQPVAGVPTVRYDKPYTFGVIRADVESLSDETGVRTLISPSVYTQNGLSHRDFFKMRDKQEIYDIFKNVGVGLSQDVFDKLWLEACETEKNEKVCVETFKNILEKHAAHKYDNHL